MLDRRESPRATGLESESASQKVTMSVENCYNLANSISSREPNGGCSKRHNLHAVDLSQRSGKPCANCVDPSRPQQWGPGYRFLDKPAMRTRWMAGNAPHKRAMSRLIQV